MRLETLVGTFGLCFMLICLSNGVRPKGRKSHKREHRGVHNPEYTTEEELMIISHLESLTKPYTGEVWKDMAREHKRKAASKCRGFEADRSWQSLYRHFFSVMMKKHRPPGAILVPESVRRTIAKASIRYTPEERKFIIAELMVATDTPFYNEKLWSDMKLKHDWCRRMGAEGFWAERSGFGLRAHFVRQMVLKGRVPEALFKKYPILYEIQKRDPKAVCRGKKQAREEEGLSENEELADEESHDRSTECEELAVEVGIDRLIENEELEDEDMDIDESEEENDENLQEVAEAMLSLK